MKKKTTEAAPAAIETPKPKRVRRRFTLHWKQMVGRKANHRRLGIPDFASKLEATIFFQQELSRFKGRSIRVAKPGYQPPHPEIQSQEGRATSKENSAKEVSQLR